MESSFGQTVPVMRVSGKMIKLQGRVVLYWLMATTMWESGLTIKRTVREITYIWAGLFTKANGKMIASTARGKNDLLMALIIEVVMRKALRKDRAFLSGRMARLIWARGVRIRCTGAVPLSGRTAENISASTRMT